MRQKAYYTAKEITNNLYTTGKEWKLPTGVEYVGAYHMYTTGEVYTEPVWSEKLSVALSPYIVEPLAKRIYKALKNDIVTTYKVVPNTSQIIITDAERKQGFCNRFFIKKTNESIIIEIDKKQFDEWVSRKIDNRLYTATQITWYISGNIQDERVNNVVKKGVITKNLEELKRAEALLSGISGKLTNLTEYYTDSDFIVPKDINK